MKTALVAGLSLIAAVSTQAFAYEQGDVVLRVGAAMVHPTGDGALNGALEVDNNTQLGLDGTYMLTHQLGIGVLAATPFKHDLNLNGVNIGSTKHLPPTVTLQYHFNTTTPLHPYLGAGVNYTQFFTERSSLGDLELKHSFGPAIEAGFDYELSKNWGANFGIWYADIDTKAKLNGAKLDTVKIDPVVYMIGAAYKF